MSAVHVRPATAGDLPSLLAFGDELREQLLTLGEGGKRGRSAAAVVRPALEERYREALADPERHLVLAVTTSRDGTEEPLGMALFTVASANALLDQPAVHMSHAVVADRARRRGAGRALVAAASAFAEDQGLDQLVVSVHPGSREANRFFARLGFAPLAVRRVAPVAVVRRRLAGEARATDHIVVARRPLRGRRRPAGVALPFGHAGQD